jgi:hypothetical protein
MQLSASGAYLFYRCERRGAAARIGLSTLELTGRPNRNRPRDPGGRSACARAQSERMDWTTGCDIDIRGQTLLHPAYLQQPDKRQLPCSSDRDGILTRSMRTGRRARRPCVGPLTSGGRWPPVSRRGGVWALTRRLSWEQLNASCAPRARIPACTVAKMMTIDISDRFRLARQRCGAARRSSLLEIQSRGAACSPASSHGGMDICLGVVRRGHA